MTSKQIAIKAQIDQIESTQLKKNVPNFRVGDTVKVHAKIVEGNKERVQIFEGVVIKRHRKSDLKATFTVRKVSYNVGVERTFLLHSPRIEKIQVISKGKVRRARLFYLRPLRGKASRIKSEAIDLSNENLDITDNSSANNNDSSTNKAAENKPTELSQESAPAA